MKKLYIFLSFFSIFTFSNYQFILGQSCEYRYKSRTFNSIQIFRGVAYSKNAPKLIAASLGTETTLNQDLVMDIFMPPPTDTVTKRPLLIIGHGGGFINVAFMGGTLLVGTKDNDDIQALCDTLAHWGYVTACIEYRTGFDIASTTSIKRAVWRGAQDMSTALRFFRKNANWFNIDTERVFTGGSSAGAFCAIHSTFIDYQERIPESYQVTPFVMTDLGALHSRPVVELTGFNPFSGNNVPANDVDSIPLGLVAYWGAIADTAMFAGTNKAAIRMFHGTADPIVSSQCAQPFANVVLTAPVTCGSEIMDIALTAQNIPHQLTLAPGESHEYWGVLNGTWTTTGPNAYWLPIIESTADYFYNLMRPAAPQVNVPAACAPNTIYTFSVINPVSSSAYCWEIDGGTIVSPLPYGNSIDVMFYTTTASGAVKCRQLDEADVASLQRVKLVNVSTLAGTDIIDNDTDFSINPNPGNDYIDITFQTLENKKSELEVFDFLGRSCGKHTVIDQFIRIDISTYPSGQYLLRAYIGNKFITKIFEVR